MGKEFEIFVLGTDRMGIRSGIYYFSDALRLVQAETAGDY